MMCLSPVQLYGSISVNATVQQLKEEATAAVEHEVGISFYTTTIMAIGVCT